jgi:hypothetical protein
VVNNLRPAGRYSHAMTMVSSKLLIFGGHVTMNDIWALDLMFENYSISLSKGLSCFSIHRFTGDPITMFSLMSSSPVIMLL